jgi:leucyl-tRNA synthetase
MKSYDHRKIEQKWQKEWEKKKTYKTSDVSKKPKFYVLDMFPYPSGEGLHVGHPRGYIGTDIFSRMKRMKGFNVLHPMGFDAFGLPAEQYAINNKIHPEVAVSKNVKRFKKQLNIIGLDYDWSREINTTDPAYYKWTQWMFLQMYKKGLAFESFEPINWCPVDKTGLANEDVENGRCERCGALVEQRPMRQWVLKITNYAEKLLDGLENLDWPMSVKESQKNWIGKKTDEKGNVTYNLRDWVFSRQRYWGEPIPLIHCDKCGVVPVPEKDLPVKLPKVKNYEPTDTGESPLAKISKWVDVKCPNCKSPAKRETNTMPQWAGSCWYYMRYMDPKNKKSFVDPKKEKYFAPVDLYVGGMEHATRHLIYARFWHKFLFDIGVVSRSEPFQRLVNQGLIMAGDGRKMSKRWGNVVNPDEIIKTYGADTLRLYEMSIGPFEQSANWSTESIIGPRRFIEKVWRVASLIRKNFSSTSLKRLLHKTIKKVSDDIEAMRFNTAISAMMILATEMEKAESIDKKDFKMFLQILAPFAPHVADELWLSVGEKKSVHISKWPEWNPDLIKQNEIKIALQVNGKVRAEIEIWADIKDEEVFTLALKNENIIKWTKGKEVRKKIYVKGRLVNLVV